MADLEVRILTQLVALPEQESSLKNLLLQLMQEQSCKTGCLRCELLQHYANVSTFVLIEDWKLESRLESGFFDERDQTLLSVAELLSEPPRLDWYEVSTTHPG